ncbi:MAG TPA: class I SAM-dependent methyltransferase [Anaeromyxobacter sp.]
MTGPAPHPVDSAAGRRAHWDGVYGSRTADQMSWYQPRPGTSLALIERTGKGTDASIVDVGGGASLLVDALLDRGFGRIAVLDISEAALGRARARLGERASRVRWIAADVTRWRPEGSFDIWHDRALFHFLVGERERETYRTLVSAAVPAGGQVVMGTFAADGPERCSGLPVRRYDPGALSAELGPGFRLLEATTEDHVTPAGKVQRFQFCRFLRV